MNTAEIPGQRIEVPLNRRTLGCMTSMIGSIWILLSVIILVPVIGNFFAKQPRGIRPDAFPLVSLGCMILLVIVLLSYRRTAAFVFTTEGFWQPTLFGGRFHPWNDLVDVQVRFYKGVPRFIIRTIRSRVTIHGTFIKDRRALMTIIRAHVKPGIAPEVPPLDEDDED